MAKIWIEPSKAKSVLNLEDSLKKALNSMSNEVDGIRGGLRYKISGQEQIAARLKDVVAQLAKEAEATGAMRTGLEQIVARYERAENSNRENAVADKTSVQQAGAGAAGDSSGWPKLVDVDLGQLQENLGITVGPGGTYDDLIRSGIPFSPFMPGILGVVGAASADGEEADSPFFKGDVKVDNKNEADIKIKTVSKDPIDNFPYQKHYYKDLETGKITEVDPNDAEAMKKLRADSKRTPTVDVKLAGVGASASWSVIDQDWSASTGWGGHEGNVSLGKVEGHADAYIGWGTIGAGIGASVTAFSVKEKGYLGTEDANVYGEVSATVGRAEAKANASAGLYDKDGNFSPNLYAGASAEAIGGEITGKAGVDIAGVDVGVEGSLNYGIGAHANVGVHDGKLSVDIGATLGVGASVKLEIDVSGAVDTVFDAAADVAGDIWSGVEGLFNW